MMQSIQKILRFISPKQEEGSGYRDTFRKELNYQSGRVMTLACASTFGWLGYIPVDRTLFPNEPLIVALRIIFPLTGIVLYTLYLLPSFKDKHLYLLTYFGAHMAISCAVLTAFTKGHPAYVGGFIFVLTLIALGPVRRMHAFSILYTAVSVFFVVGFVKGMDISNPVSRYSLNDVTAVTIVTSFFIYILDNIRFTSWQKSKTIEMNRRIIENQNKLLEHQIELAGELQKKLLPMQLPVVENAALAFTYHPMMKVGGDFVDVCYVLDEQGLGLFVCDVSGHGIAAAFISSMVKMALANWRDYLAMPHQMLNQLYYALVEKLGANFVTASICYVDLKSGMARFSGAGHPPALIVRSGGEIEYIKPRGKIINGIMSPYFGVEEKSLGNKDKIVFYTDGITECINERGEMFGDEAFISLVKTYRNFSPHDMCENIMEHMKEYIGTASFNDDITLLIMEFHEENI